VRRKAGGLREASINSVTELSYVDGRVEVSANKCTCYCNVTTTGRDFCEVPARLICRSQGRSLDACHQNSSLNTRELLDWCRLSVLWFHSVRVLAEVSMISSYSSTSTSAVSRFIHLGLVLSI